MKFYEVSESKTKWVQPFEDNPFRVQLRRLSEEETNRVFDRHKILPNSPKNSMAKFSAVTRDMMLDAVLAWESPETTPLGNVPCDRENKLRMTKVMVVHDGDEGEEVTESLWAIVSRKFNDEEEAELKN